MLKKQQHVEIKMTFRLLMAATGNRKTLLMAPPLIIITS